jgi:hypothetical protein
LLKNLPLGVTQVIRNFDAIDWNVLSDQRVSADAEAARDGSGRINVYPSLFKKSKNMAEYCVLREFGRLVLEKAGADAKRGWEMKLSLPCNEQIDAVQAKLSPSAGSYLDIVEFFNTAVCRLVTLNICNALIANGVPITQCQNVNLRQWGPTQEYCNRRRYHSLIPLLSAYASKEIFEDYGAAFADLACGLCGITESTVADATHALIVDIAKTLG